MGETKIYLVISIINSSSLLYWPLNLPMSARIKYDFIRATYLHFNTLLLFCRKITMPPKKPNLSRETRNAKNMAKNYAKEGSAEKQGILMALRRQQKTEKITLCLQQVSAMNHCPCSITGHSGLHNFFYILT
jgi:hypothetical protein